MSYSRVILGNPERESNQMADPNRKPEQEARDQIDRILEQAGWVVQSKNKIDFSAGSGIAVREYQTDVGRRLRPFR